MNLFNEIKSKYYNIVYDIIYHIHKNGSLNRNQISKLIDSHYFYNYDFIKALLNEISEDYNFDILEQADNMYRTKFEDSFYINPLIFEKIWLKNILADPKIHLFLTQDTIIKLNQVLRDTDNIVNSTIIVRNTSVNDSLISDDIKTILDNFFTALKADKGIKYTYKMRSGNIIEDAKGIPYKIEYSVRDDLFYLISYSLDDYRPIKSLLKNFLTIDTYDLSDEEKKIKEEIPIRMDYKKEAEPVVLQVIDEINTVERAFLDFSCFERKAKKVDGVYELSIHYYSFEEEVILSKILSLGRYVKVKHPEKIRNLIIERIKNSVEVYQ